MTTTANKFNHDHKWTLMLDEAAARAFGLRWERAVDLLTAGAVHEAGSGIYQVTSQTDNQIRYWVSPGVSCTCPDTHRAPWGWCKHQLAVWMYQETEMEQRDLDWEENAEQMYKFQSWDPNVEARHWATPATEKGRTQQS